MLNPKVAKFYSPISGFGLKTVAQVQAGEVLMKFEGQLISKDQADDLYQTGYDYLLQISPNEFLNLAEDTKYVNHSCNPSAAFLHQNGELVALRDLDLGTEITFDYSANENTDFKLTCRCGSPQCRGVILPLQANEEQVQKLLQPLLSPYLRTHYGDKGAISLKSKS
jgi:SET domain-containing protein